MKVQNIIGADLSKKTIDLVFQMTGEYFQINNNSAGFKDFLKRIRQYKIDLNETLVVMEHTGLYSFLFEQFLEKNHVPFKKVGALEIKRSSGLVRGKSDKIDAARIAAYGFEKRNKLSGEPPNNHRLKDLKMLYSTRDRLVKSRAGLLNAVKEYRHIEISEKDLLIQSQLQVIKTLDKQIERVEKAIENLIKEDESLNCNFKLVMTVKGVGKVVALAIIIKTENFTRFTNSRKFACYCGTAPFEHSSGTSIKKRTRVSHLADKQMKTLLDLAAKSAIQHDQEIKQFYGRRIEIGKSKMSTINIVRNKILYRIFAVVKRQTPFMEQYLQVA